MNIIRIAKWQNISELPDSPDCLWQGSSLTVTRVFEGEFALLMAARPAEGDVMRDLLPQCKVRSVRIKKVKAGRGHMSVVLKGVPLAGSSPGEAEEEDKGVCELDWVQHQEPIENNPYYADLGIDMFALVDQYFAAGDEATREAVKHDIDGNGGKVVELWTDRLNGHDSYMAFYPVATRVRLADVAFVSQAGILETPPVECYPPEGYEWIKTADRKTYSGDNGEAQRSEEWTGFKKIDAKLYGGVA